jgi:hypothetical protein
MAYCSQEWDMRKLSLSTLYMWLRVALVDQKLSQVGVDNYNL